MFSKVNKLIASFLMILLCLTFFSYSDLGARKMVRGLTPSAAEATCYGCPPGQCPCGDESSSSAGPGAAGYTQDPAFGVRIGIDAAALCRALGGERRMCQALGDCINMDNITSIEIDEDCPVLKCLNSFGLAGDDMDDEGMVETCSELCKYSPDNRICLAISCMKDPSSDCCKSIIGPDIYETGADGMPIIDDEGLPTLQAGVPSVCLYLDICPAIFTGILNFDLSPSSNVDNINEAIKTQSEFGTADSIPMCCSVLPSEIFSSILDLGFDYSFCEPNEDNCFSIFVAANNIPEDSITFSGLPALSKSLYDRIIAPTGELVPVMIEDADGKLIPQMKADGITPVLEEKMSYNRLDSIVIKDGCCELLPQGFADALISAKIAELLAGDGTNPLLIHLSKVAKTDVGREEAINFLDSVPGFKTVYDKILEEVGMVMDPVCTAYECAQFYSVQKDDEGVPSPMISPKCCEFVDSFDMLPEGLVTACLLATKCMNQMNSAMNDAGCCPGETIECPKVIPGTRILCNQGSRPCAPFYNMHEVDKHCSSMTIMVRDQGHYYPGHTGGTTGPFDTFNSAGEFIGKMDYTRSYGGGRPLCYGYFTPYTQDPNCLEINCQDFDKPECTNTGKEELLWTSIDPACCEAVELIAEFANDALSGAVDGTFLNELIDSVCNMISSGPKCIYNYEENGTIDPSCCTFLQSSGDLLKTFGVSEGDEIFDAMKTACEFGAGCFNELYVEWDDGMIPDPFGAPGSPEVPLVTDITDPDFNAIIPQSCCNAIYAIPGDAIPESTKETFKDICSSATGCIFGYLKSVDAGDDTPTISSECCDTILSLADTVSGGISPEDKALAINICSGITACYNNLKKLPLPDMAVSTIDPNDPETYRWGGASHQCCQLLETIATAAFNDNLPGVTIDMDMISEACVSGTACYDQYQVSGKMTTECCAAASLFPEIPPEAISICKSAVGCYDNYKALIAADNAASKSITGECCDVLGDLAGAALGSDPETNEVIAGLDADKLSAMCSNGLACYNAFDITTKSFAPDMSYCCDIIEYIPDMAPEFKENVETFCKTLIGLGLKCLNDIIDGKMIDIDCCGAIEEIEESALLEGKEFSSYDLAKTCEVGLDAYACLGEYNKTGMIAASCCKLLAYEESIPAAVKKQCALAASCYSQYEKDGTLYTECCTLFVEDRIDQVEAKEKCDEGESIYHCYNNSSFGTQQMSKECCELAPEAHIETCAKLLGCSGRDIEPSGYHPSHCCDMLPTEFNGEKVVTCEVTPCSGLTEYLNKDVTPHICVACPDGERAKPTRDGCEPLPPCSGELEFYDGTACIACPGGKMANPENNACIDMPDCGGSDEFLNGIECEKCPAGKIANPLNSGCQAVPICPGADRFLDVDYSCTTCPPGEMANGANNGCVPLPTCPGTHEYLNGTSCATCPAGEMADGTNSGCISEPDCGTFGYYTSGSCADCPMGTMGNAANNGCVALPRCSGLYEILSIDECTDCPAGQMAGPSNTTCLMIPDCGPLQHLSGAMCSDCPPGQVGSGSTCIPLPACSGDKEYLDGFECAICPDGEIANIENNGCFVLPVCDGDYEYLDGAICTTCPFGFMANDAKDGCIPLPDCDGNDEIREGIECVTCPTDLVANRENNACIDRPLCGMWNEYLYGTVCVACPDGQTANALNDGCEPFPDCFDPLEYLSDGSCVACLADEVANMFNNACVSTCPDQFEYFFEDNCITCPDGEMSNVVNDGCVPLPECAHVLEYLNVTECEPCPDGQMANPTNDGCVPLPDCGATGYFDLITRSCDECGGNEETDSSGFGCQCLTGYTRTASSECTLDCSSGSVISDEWSLTGCSVSGGKLSCSSAHRQPWSYYEGWYGDGDDEHRRMCGGGVYSGAAGGIQGPYVRNTYIDGTARRIAWYARGHIGSGWRRRWSGIQRLIRFESDNPICEEPDNIIGGNHCAIGSYP